MFARDGSVWTDDTYNFNISDNFDGNDSNKTSSRNYKMTGDKLGAGRSKQTRLAKKHSLNKSTPKKSSRRSTPSEHQESPESSNMNSTAVIGVDDTRRKSAPPATASALDKAMSFLQKYKKEGSTLGNEQTNNGRRWSAANASSDDEDISLDSENDNKMSRKVVKSRLKPNRTPPAPEPSRREESAHDGAHFGANRSLTDVPPSNHFATAKDLGITVSDRLDQAQTAVSGIDTVGFRVGDQTNTCLPQECLRFTVITPGSPSSDMVGQGQGQGQGSDIDCMSSVKSMISTIVEDIQPEEHGGRRISCSDLASSGEIDARESSNRNGTKLGQEGERPTDQREDDDSLYTIGEEYIPEATGDDCGSSGEQVPDGREDDDSYEDDDFEEVDDNPLERSDRDLDGDGSVICKGNRQERDPSPTPMRDDSKAGTCSRWRQGTSSVIRPSNLGVQGRQDLSYDGTHQACDQGTRATSPFVSASTKGNDSDKHHEVLATSNCDQNNLPATKEAWVVEGRVATPPAYMAAALTATQYNAESSGQKQALDGDRLDRAQQALDSAESVSKRGVRIDRSAEVRSPQRPPHSAIKTICSNAVASVEFAHDPGRGLDLRSIGTQAIGNTAAVQVDIVCPGMSGTNSVLDDDLEARRVKKASVGYHVGESYAKWERFACEVPARGSGGQQYGQDQGATVASHYRLLDEEVGTAESIPETINAGGEPSSTIHGGGKVDDQSYAQVSMRSDPFGAPGIPSYLQVFLDVMAKSQEESCAAWTKAIEDTVETRGSDPSSGPVEGNTSEETKWLYERGDADAFMGIDTANISGMMMSTQDSFRKQLADLRRNLNQIRRRAEAATFSSCGHAEYKYETLAEARKFIDRVRPSATSYAKELRIVDPSLTPKESKAMADGDHQETIPGTPTGPCTTTDCAE